MRELALKVAKCINEYGIVAFPNCNVEQYAEALYYDMQYSLELGDILPFTAEAIDYLETFGDVGWAIVEEIKKSIKCYPYNKDCH